MTIREIRNPSKWWLIDVNTHQLNEFVDSQAPVYAILSHVWGRDEVSFPEIEQPLEQVLHKAGHDKIIKCCLQTAKLGIQYVWIDTCCIDKRNSADLSEAINSMYRYYRNAAICLIYLADVPGFQQADGRSVSKDEQLVAMRRSRWFTRGWTLQELVVPRKRLFFAGDWSSIEFSHEIEEISLLSNASNVTSSLLKHERSIESFPVAQPMSWAAARQTTRGEDLAYCLMGLFDINMPVLYGEGQQKAFIRLQKEILQISFDQSIFAWRGEYSSSGLLARSPADFAGTPHLRLSPPYGLETYSFTNLGLSINLYLAALSSENSKRSTQTRTLRAALQCRNRVGEEWLPVVVYLREIGRNVTASVNGKSCRMYRRVHCSKWETLHPQDIGDKNAYEDIWNAEHVLVLEQEHYESFLRTWPEAFRRDRLLPSREIPRLEEGSELQVPPQVSPAETF